MTKPSKEQYLPETDEEDNSLVTMSDEQMKAAAKKLASSVKGKKTAKSPSKKGVLSE